MILAIQAVLILAAGYGVAVVATRVDGRTLADLFPSIFQERRSGR
jgi:hypothetical protein